MSALVVSKMSSSPSSSNCLSRSSSFDLVTLSCASASNAASNSSSSSSAGLENSPERMATLEVRSSPPVPEGGTNSGSNSERSGPDLEPSALAAAVAAHGEGVLARRSPSGTGRASSPAGAVVRMST